MSVPFCFCRNTMAEARKKTESGERWGRHTCSEMRLKKPKESLACGLVRKCELVHVNILTEPTWSSGTVA